MSASASASAPPTSTLILAHILRPLADTLTFLTTHKIHDTFFPYTYATTLHAVRVSMVYQANMQRARNAHTHTNSHNQTTPLPLPLPWRTYIAGYLLMSWGGMVGTHILLGLPPPILYSIHPWINYISMHLVVTAVYTYALSSSVSAPGWDRFLFPLDAILRANSVTSALTLLSTSATAAADPRLASSPLFHLILGCVAASGGGVVAGTLQTWRADWEFRTPVFLRGDVGMWGALDVWGGGVVALIYSTLSLHPAFTPLSILIGQNIVLSPLGAKAFATGVLAVLFGVRVLVNAGAGRGVKSEKREKVKTQ